MKRIMFLLFVLMTFSAQAGVLADKFKAYANKESVMTQDKSNEVDFALEAVIATPVPGPSMVREYQLETLAFIDGLPKKLRMNKNTRQEGEPEIYFSQPNPNSRAEVIIIMHEGTVYGITYMCFSPQDGIKFKKDIQQMLSK